MSEKAQKRLVSKGQYVLRKTLAISLSVGLSACGIGALLLLLGLPYSYYLEAQTEAAQRPYSNSDNFSLQGLGIAFAWWLCLILLPVLGITASALWWGSRKSWKTVRALQPINFADTTALSEVETLVRASDLLPSHQQAELLRAAQHGKETPPEELLRATITNGEQE